MRRSVSHIKELQSLYAERDVAAKVGLETFQKAVGQIESSHRTELLEVRRVAYLNKPQRDRVQLIVKELLGFSQLELRAFYYVLGLKEKKALGLIPLQDTGEVDKMRTQGYWPAIHPTNLAFQEEIGCKGVLGLHGLPKAFMDKLLSGEMFNKIDLQSGPAPVQVEAPAPEEPKNQVFDLFLKGFSPEFKVRLIKEVKDMLSLGLKDAKDKLEAASTTPLLLAKRVKPEDALVEKLKSLGAELEFVKIR